MIFLRNKILPGNLPEEKRKTLVDLLVQIEAAKEPERIVRLKEDFLMAYALAARSGYDVSEFFKYYLSIVDEREIFRHDKFPPIFN